MSSFSPSTGPSASPVAGHVAGPAEQPGPGVTRAVRRHLFLFLVVLVALPVLAALLLSQRAPSYTSTATIYLRPTTGNALSPDSAKNSQQVTVAMETEAGLVEGPAVAELVSKELGRTVTAGSTDVSALVPPNTQMVQISYTDSTPGRARAGAQAYAQAFLDNREAVAKDVNDRQLDLLNEQAGAVSRNLEKVSADAASDNPSPESAALVQLNGNRLSNLQDLIGQLQATDIDPGSVVTPATTPSRGTGLDPRLMLAAAVLLGLLLATVLAVWRDRADDRIRTEEEDGIGAVPYFATLQGGLHPLANAYRQIRALLLTSVGQPAVVVVSAADDASVAPVTTVAANLAATLTDASYRVCLVDLSETADLGTILPTSPAAGGPGIDQPREFVQALPSARRITVLTADRLPVDDPGLLVSVRFADLVTTLRNSFDVVLIAAAPALTARGTESALAADTMLLLVTDRKSTHDQVADVITRQARMRVPVVGMVALRANPRANNFDALPPDLEPAKLAPETEPAATGWPQPIHAEEARPTARQIRLPESSTETTQPMRPIKVGRVGEGSGVRGSGGAERPGGANRSGDAGRSGGLDGSGGAGRAGGVDQPGSADRPGKKATRLVPPRPVTQDPNEQATGKGR